MVSNDAAIQVGDPRLSIEDVVHVAREKDRYVVADLTETVKERVQESADWVEETVDQIHANGKEAECYYGINTGFGALAGKEALGSAYHTQVLMRNLIASHSVGMGEYFDEETVRSAMLVRAHTLAQGHSGVRPEIIQKLIDMLNKRVYPAVPCKGSLGASGDLAPLSHLALVISKVPEPPSQKEDLRLDSTSGEAFIPYIGQAEEGADKNTPGQVTFHVTTNRRTGRQTLWQQVSGEKAMKCIGGQIELRAKEGLALNNGATFSAAVAALSLYDAWNLLQISELGLAMTLEAMGGFRDPFFPNVHKVRGHEGAKETAANVLSYVHGSELLDPGTENQKPQRTPPQDPYSVRCAPQVLGMVRDTLKFVQGIIEKELNAATDNPLIFMDLPRGYKTVSGGNFHGEPIAMAMDFLGIAITELGNIAERRIFMLTDYKLADLRDQVQAKKDEQSGDAKWHGFPDFLIKQDHRTKGTDGLNSGLMIAQYTAASLVSDCKTLAHPDSVDSIPSSANQEDHVSMSLNAARHARQIVDNIESVIAIELLCAVQALDLRMKFDKSLGGEEEAKEKLGSGTRAVHQRIRKEVEYLDFDRVLYPDIRKIVQLIRSGELVNVALQEQKYKKQ